MLFRSPDILRNGEDRAHRLYGTEENSAKYVAKPGEEIIYRFDKSDVKSVHVVFDSDLNRSTLDGSVCERTHTTRANVKLDAPMMHLPTTLCKSFTLYGELNGERCELLCVDLNRKRSYHVNVNKCFDTLALIPNESWGGENIPIVSFDFE